MATLLGERREVCKQIVRQMIGGLDPELRTTLTSWPWMRQEVVDDLWKELGMVASANADSHRVHPYRLDLSPFGNPTVETLKELFGAVDPRFAESRQQNGVMYGKRFEHLAPANGIHDLVIFNPKAVLQYDDVIDWGQGTSFRVCQFVEGCSFYKSIQAGRLEAPLPLALLGTTFFVGDQRYVAVMEHDAVSLMPRDRVYGSQIKYLLIRR